MPLYIRPYPHESQFGPNNNKLFTSHQRSDSKKTKRVPRIRVIPATPNLKSRADFPPLKRPIPKIRISPVPPNLKSKTEFPPLKRSIPRIRIIPAPPDLNNRTDFPPLKRSVPRIRIIPAVPNMRSYEQFPLLARPAPNITIDLRGRIQKKQPSPKTPLSPKQIRSLASIHFNQQKVAWNLGQTRRASSDHRTGQPPKYPVQQPRFTKGDARIGSGRFGTIHPIPQTDKLVLKQIHRNQTKEKRDKYELFIKNEIAFLNAQNTTLFGVPHVLDYSMNSKHVDIAMKRIQGEELWTYVVRHHYLPELTSVKILAELIIILEQAHILGIMHQDLKPENIMIDKQGHAHIIDWGLACLESRKKHSCGSPHYSAPEVWLGKNFNRKRDIWSLGIIFYAMLTGKLPFKHHNQTELTKLILIGKFALPKSVSTSAANLLSHLLVTEPARRYSLQDIKNHFIFAQHKIDFKAIRQYYEQERSSFQQDTESLMKK